ncbi:MAG TPA: DNA-deoxyinosine glycosylase [Candidatus Deferrimicrobium sp.]|nr:DNA-deoxyinosine glycosylase [Candidatus Deferrimicrobium sp.]
MSEAKSFQPIIDPTSKVLILGSMPGVQSLEQQKYYANPQNQFWRIIYSIFDTPLDPDYQHRIAFIKGKGIGLWDVLESCDREGSLDSNIRNEKANDFVSLFKTFPNIHCVLFNGTKAYEAFRKGVGFDRFGSTTFKRMPSTSPANAQKFEQKLSEWYVLLNYIDTKGVL